VRRILVLAVVLVGLLAGTAQADDFSAEDLPLNRPAATPFTSSVEVVAEQYWAKRGIALPAGVEVFTASLLQLGDQIARAELGGHRIWMSGFLLHPWTVENRAGFCQVYIHERGHNAGLLDMDGWPIMGVSPPPPMCWKWAQTP
jgi:hypothetical protein